ncbi:replication endonuclease [Vibrio sp. Of7-15]|uniref:replication endonuclease n=1 Tax=Vibrio sp. Of7-15 TaxID=2724879 RepID=UPI001EF2BF74|nr:replication endonuclease [Vibrio sp. Of7-15]MCG7497762.1 replication endonuclease [Vibrio sp. Of7-15]
MQVLSAITPNEAILVSHTSKAKLWRDDSKWVRSLFGGIPSDIAVSLLKQYVFRWERYVQRNGKSRSANIWLRRQVTMVREAAGQFPVQIERLRNEIRRKSLASELADQCHRVLMSCIDQRQDAVATAKVMRDVWFPWSFMPSVPTQSIPQEQEESNEEYEARIEETVALGQIARLINEAWWLRKLDIAYRRFCEHCRIIMGQVRKGVSAYISHIGLQGYRARKIANLKALSNIVARNELTGEEIDVIEAVKASVSNPKIRRHELMVRMRGFEDIATENGLMGGFFTMTAPSKYHSYHSVRSNGKTCSVENKKYQGFNPKQTQRYLSHAWSKARAKLKRLDVPLMGFRVCEPHHDATPHWHALFFFHPEHEPVIRWVLAHYFTEEDRSELGASDVDFKCWSDAIAKTKDEDGKFTLPLSEESTEHIETVSALIKPRFDYKVIDPECGSATGYIAKYIAKNIDGFKVEDDEESGEKAEVTAESVAGWASEWGIRQFQQIGGPSVSVWRELRRLEQDPLAIEEQQQIKSNPYKPQVRSFFDLQSEEHQIEVARVAADSGNWGMFVEAMGGVFCARNAQPLRLAYRPKENGYGELVTKLKGVTNGVDLTVISRMDGWVLCKKTPSSDLTLKSSVSTPETEDFCASWSSVNNCTRDKSGVLKQSILGHFECNGIDVDKGGVAAMIRGDTVFTLDGRKTWLDRTHIGLQVRVEEVLEEVKWEGW